ncbi:MAG: GNAT family N-acetyltransferase [Clostridiales bacterium]|nr:GNAT family N-acetyltransferase [Clostridiales bacterium]
MLTLIPADREHMPFRQALLADPATMAYNAPWSPPDGTVPFPESAWDAWLAKWTNHEPERFCGYVATADGTPVGEICWHGHGAGMGVVIHASHRGKGYGAEALQLLIRRAFSHPEISRLENQFESARAAALHTHLNAGFVQAGTDAHGSLTLILTRAAHRERLLRRLTDAMCQWERGVPDRIHHLIKVHGFARQIGQMELLDEDTLFILEAAALTHDIGIRPAIAQTGACPGPLQERLGPPEAETMLHGLHFPREVIDRVCFLIGRHHTTQGVDAPDWQILLEADFLVNMIENHMSGEAIDACRDRVFRTGEGLRLLHWIRPPQHG